MSLLQFGTLNININLNQTGRQDSDYQPLSDSQNGTRCEKPCMLI